MFFESMFETSTLIRNVCTGLSMMLTLTLHTKLLPIRMHSSHFLFQLFLRLLLLLLLDYLWSFHHE